MGLLGRTDMTYDEFIALGAPELPIGYTYRLTYEGNKNARLEIVEEYPTFFLGRTKYRSIISRVFNINMSSAAYIALGLYDSWQREVSALQQSSIGVMER